MKYAINIIVGLISIFIVLATMYCFMWYDHTLHVQNSVAYDVLNIQERTPECCLT
jgi:accessory gene regulator protein AgrB